MGANSQVRQFLLQNYNKLCMQNVKIHNNQHPGDHFYPTALSQIATVGIPQNSFMLRHHP